MPTGFVVPRTSGRHDPWNRWPGEVCGGAVRRERVTGLLVDAIASGALPTTPAQLEEATQSHLASMVTSLRLDQRLLVASAALDNAGVTYRVLKGPAIAHLSYPHPALRSYG